MKKYPHTLGLEKLILLKGTYYPKKSIDLMWFMVKLPMMFFTKLEQIILKLIWNHKRHRIAKAILRKKNKAGGITLPDFRQYDKLRAIKMVWDWHKNRQMDQQNRESRSRPIYLQSINLWQRKQEYTHGETSLFSNWCWESWTAACKLTKSEHTLIPYTKTQNGLKT